MDGRKLRAKGPTTLVQVDRKVLVLCADVVVQQKEYRGFIDIHYLSRQIIVNGPLMQITACHRT